MYGRDVNRIYGESLECRDHEGVGLGFLRFRIHGSGILGLLFVGFRIRI